MISVLTPSFGYAQFISAALCSTDLDGVQHVVQDGASVDGTVDVLRALERPGLVWRSQPDAGQSDALNRSLELAQGDIVGWLNADEFYLPGALETAQAFFDANPAVDALYGDVAYVDAEGRFVRLLVGYPFSRQVLRWRGCIIPSATFFVRRELLGSSPWDTSLRTVMDWDLFLGLVDRGAVIHYVREPLAAFRLHTAQVTATPLPRCSDEHAIVRRKYRITQLPFGAVQRVGDYHHRARKLSFGSRALERRAAQLQGLPMLDGGTPSAISAAPLLGLYWHLTNGQPEA